MVIAMSFRAQDGTQQELFLCPGVQTFHAFSPLPISRTLCVSFTGNRCR